MKKFEKIKEHDPCPYCHSKATTTVRYIGENSYMGDWLRCRGCGGHTQTYQPPLGLENISKQEGKQ